MDHVVHTMTWNSCGIGDDHNISVSLMPMVEFVVVVAMVVVRNSTNARTSRRHSTGLLPRQQPIETSMLSEWVLIKMSLSRYNKNILNLELLV